ACVRASVLRDMFSRGQDGEEGRFHSWNRLDEPRRIGAAAAILDDLPSVRVEPVGLPFVILREHGFARRDLVQARNPPAMRKQRTQLVPNCGPARFDARNPMKLRGGKKWMLAN